MRNILKVSNTTPMQLIQSGTFHYIEQVCDGSNGLRYGGAVSSYLSAEAFYVSGNTTEVSVGDVIYYYREYDVDKDFTAITPAVEELIGIFTVEQVEKGKHGYAFVAYDNIRKLDTDYSSEILSAKASFPMTHNAFLSAIQTFMSNLGVTVDFTGLDAFSDTTHTISYFYAQSLTVMDILRNYAALECSYLKCNSNGDVTFTQFTGDASYQTAYWYNTDRYIIAPTDQTTYTGYAYINGSRVLTNLIPIYYKQDGLSKEDYFIVPFKYWKVSNLDGSKMSQSQFFPTPGFPTPQGNYWLTSNFVFEYSSLGSFVGITKQSNFNSMLKNKIYPFEVHLFPFRCPFGAGCYIPHIEDTYGTRFASIVMKMDWSDFEVILSCENPQYYQDDIQKNADTDYREQSITIEVNRLQELITGLDNSKVSKSGDTMTGGLKITGITSSADTALILKDNTYGITALPSSTVQRYVFSVAGKDDEALGYMRSYLSSAGESGVSLYGRNKVNGSAVVNGITLLVSANGTKQVNLTDADSWLTALGLGTSGALPITIAQGGTGATTKENAKVNLDIGNFSVSYLAVSGNSSGYFNLSNNERGAIICTGTTDDVKDFLIYNVNSSGTVSVKRLSNASGITLTTATRKLTIADSISAYCYCVKLAYTA